MRQVAEETISIEQFPYETQKALDISLEKAKKISLELYKKVISLAEKTASTAATTKKITGSTIKIKPVPKFIEKPLSSEAPAGAKEEAPKKSIENQSTRPTRTHQPIRPTQTQQSKIQQPKKQMGEDRYRETIE